MALTSVIIGGIGTGVLVATLVAAPLAQFAENIPEYRDRFNDVLASYNLGIKIDEFLPDFMKSDDKKQGENRGEETDENDETSERLLITRREELAKSNSGAIRLVSDIKPIGVSESSLVVEASVLKEGDDINLKSESEPNEESDGTQNSDTSESQKHNTFTVGAAAVDTSSQELYSFLSRLAADLSYFGSNAFLVVLM